MTEESHDDNPVSDSGVPPPPEPSIIDRLGISSWGYALLVLGIVFFLYQIIGSIISLFVFKTPQVTPENVQGVRIQTGLAQIFLLLIPTLILARIQTKDLRSVFRIKVPRFKSVFFAIIGVFALQQVLQVYLFFQDQIPLPHFVKPQVDEIRKLIEEIYRVLIASHSVPELLFVILIVALIPSICEELLFRGLVQRNFEKSSPIKWLGIIVTGIIFGVYHLNPFSLIPLIALGIYFGYIVYKSDSILVAIIAHFFNNAVAVLASYFHIDDEMVGTLASGTVTIPVILGNFVVFSVIAAVSTIAFHYSVKPEAGEG
jgi:membrane protease YdiL (CAAX protease family)